MSGSDLAQWDADHLLPSLTTLVIRPSAHDADGRPHTDRSRVPWESARTVQPDRAPPSHTGDAIAAGVIAGVVVGALVIWYIGYSISSSIDECGSNFSQVRASAMPCDLHHVHRAEYDFDRYAGAYVEPEAALAAR